MTDPQFQAEAKPSLPKYELFRLQSEEALDGLWDETLSLSFNLKTLINQAVILPYANIQLPIVTAYLLIPSAIASIVPILYMYGARGSGKSSISIIAAALHRTEVFSSATTFAATRNALNQQRWLVPEMYEHEQNTCLVLDNINRDTLLNEQLYTFLLNGYNRKTDTISISKGNGENLTFRVFSPKILSSVHALYGQSKFSELGRRCLVIKCKPFEQMSPIEAQDAQLSNTFSLLDKLNPEELDLSLLNQKFDIFWNNEENLTKYALERKQLTTRKKNFKVPKSITGARWTIMIDLIATGITTGIWGDNVEAVEALNNYWDWHDTHIANEYGATHKLLQSFVVEETVNAQKYNNQLGYEAYPLELNPEKLKKHVNWASSQGMLDIVPSPAHIAEIMADIGWRLDKGVHGKIVWMPTNK